MSDQQSKNAAIIGATGLVGRQLINLLLDEESYDEVHYIGRKKIDIENPKLVQHIINLDSIDSLSLTSPIDDAFCALGTTIKVAKSEENFVKVDRDYVCHFAKKVKSAGAETFSVNSSLGADAESGSFYLRTKGQMEACLRETNFNSLIIVRPSLLVPTGRKPSRFGEVISYKVMQVFGWLMIGKARRYKPVSPFRVATSMIRAAGVANDKVTILESEQL